MVSGATAACGDQDLTVGSGALQPSQTDSKDTVWTGYVEDFKFKSGSDRITVRFTSPSSGTVVFGELPSGPPSADPGAPYPAECNFDFRPGPNGALSEPDNPTRCVERFELPMREVVQEPDRLRFTVDTSEKWATWCKGQSLIIVTGWFGGGGATYGCAGVAPVERSECQAHLALADGGPGLPLDEDAGKPIFPMPDTFVDCRLQATCGRVCKCTATACETSPSNLVRFDLHVDGKDARGTSSLGTVYLTAK